MGDDITFITNIVGMILGSCNNQVSNIVTMTMVYVDADYRALFVQGIAYIPE